MNILVQMCMATLSFEWLKEHLLPCPFKYFTGIDCPGCGFQRSLIALLQGDFAYSFALYPATIPLLLTFAYVLIDRKFSWDTPDHKIKKTVYLITGSFILITYGLKMYHLYNYATPSWVIIWL